MVNGTTTARELTPTTLELDSSKGKNNSNFLALISHRLHSGPMAFFRVQKISPLTRGFSGLPRDGERIQVRALFISSVYHTRGHLSSGTSGVLSHLQPRQL